MAYYGFKDVALYVGGYNVSGDVSGVTFKASAITQEWVFAGQTAPTVLDTGQRRGEIGCNGIYNNISGTTPILANLTGTDQVVTLIHEGGTVSTRCWNLRTAKVSEVELGFDTEQLDSLTTAFAITGACNQGYIVAPLAARTTDGNTQSTYADGGTSSTGARAFLHVTSIDVGGGNGVTVTVQSSADHSSWADCSAAFTKRSTVGAESIALAGTVERYLAIKWAWDGGSNQTFTGFVAVSRD